CSYASSSGTSSRSMPSLLPRFGSSHNAGCRASPSADAGGLALREDEPLGRGVDDDRVAVAALAPQQLVGGSGRRSALEPPLQRPGAEVGVVTDTGDVRAGLVAQDELQVALGQPLLELLHLESHDLLDVPLVEPVKHDDLVDAVEELGLEVRPHR